MVLVFVIVAEEVVEVYDGGWGNRKIAKGIMVMDVINLRVMHVGFALPLLDFDCRY